MTTYIIEIHDIRLEKNLLIYKTIFILIKEKGNKGWQVKLKKEIS